MTDEEILIQKENIKDDFFRFLEYDYDLDKIKELLLKRGYDKDLVNDYLNS